MQLIAVRQRLTTEANSVLADGDKSLGSYGVKEEDTVYLKDLGRQISWRTVFIIEYVRPSCCDSRPSCEVEEAALMIWLPARLLRSSSDPSSSTQSFSSSTTSSLA